VDRFSAILFSFIPEGKSRTIDFCNHSIPPHCKAFEYFCIFGIVPITHQATHQTKADVPTSQAVGIRPSESTLYGISLAHPVTAPCPIPHNTLFGIVNNPHSFGIAFVASFAVQ